ncbi:hypothetical protein V8C86DRAFT_2613644 [Haematococcus lacustris]
MVGGERPGGAGVGGAGGPGSPPHQASSAFRTISLSRDNRLGSRASGVSPEQFAFLASSFPTSYPSRHIPVPMAASMQAGPCEHSVTSSSAMTQMHSATSLSRPSSMNNAGHSSSHSNLAAMGSTAAAAALAAGLSLGTASYAGDGGWPIAGGSSSGGAGGQGGHGGTLSPRSQVAVGESRQAGGAPAPPICLICLQLLTPEEFASGEALQLQCLCKGEVALRHKACVIAWTNVKGNLQCDICKATIANLPDIDPAILAAKEAARRRRDPAFLVSSDLTALDYVFDAVRVTWVVVIVCILFTNGMNTSNTFLIGATAGLCYAIISMVLHELWKMYRRRRREAAAAVAAASGGLPASSPTAPAAATSARSPTSRRGSPSGGLTQPLLVPGSAAHDIV